MVWHYGSDTRDISATLSRKCLSHSGLPVNRRWNIKIVVVSTNIKPEDVRVICDWADNVIVGQPLRQILLRTRVVRTLRIREISGDKNNCRLQISLQIRAFQVQIWEWKNFIIFCFQYGCLWYMIGQRRPTDNKSINIKNHSIDFPPRTEIYWTESHFILWTFLAVVAGLFCPGRGILRDAGRSGEPTKWCCWCWTRPSSVRR